MDVTRIVLRLIHIFSGVFWVGAVWMLTTYIGSTARALGKDAAPFMQHFTLRSGFQRTISIAAGLSLLSGSWLYWINFGDAIVVNTGRGLALTFGATAGIIAFFIGALVIGRNTNKIRALADSMAASGGPPSKDNLGMMQSLQEKVASAGALTAVFMVLALIGMTLSEHFAI